MRVLPKIFLFCILCAFTLRSVSGSSWSAEKALSIKKINMVSVSPDHSKTAYLVQNANLTDGVWEKRIVVVDLINNSEIFVIEGLVGISQLSWTKDSESIWFLAKGDKAQALWKGLINNQKVEKIYEAQENIQTFLVSPDETKIAYIAPYPIKEKYLPSKAYQATQPDGLWIRTLNSSEESTLVTTEKMFVGFHDGGRLSFSPDSAFVAFSYSSQEKIGNYVPMWSSCLALADCTELSYKDLVSDGSMNTSPAFSHDGKWIAFVSNASSLKRKEPNQYYFTQVQIISTNGKEKKELSKTFDQRPDLLGWADDNRNVFVTESKGIKQKIYKLSCDGGKPKIWPEKEDESNFIPFLNQRGNSFGLISSEFDHPPEVFVTLANEYRPKKISSLQSLEIPKLGTSQVIAWKANDGTLIEGILILPNSYEKGKPVPLVVACHGGPNSAWTEAFIGSADEQAVPICFGLLADAGYALLAPNPRGSIGYGPQFTMKNFRDLGGGDLQDIFSGVDELIAQGIADKERLAIWGWSYGGYLSARAITQTSRFKAAIVGAGLTNLISFSGTSDIGQVYLPSYFDKYFWQDPSIYLKRSPIMDIAKVTTPTLLQYGEEDIRVPITQGIEFFQGLKVRSVPVELFLFPHEPHVFIRNPKSVVIGLRQLLDWLNTYVVISSADLGGFVGQNNHQRPGS